MTRDLSPEDIERLLGAFAVGEPSEGLQERIAASAVRWRTRRRAFVVSGAAAAALLALGVGFGPWVPRGPTVMEYPATVWMPVAAAEDLESLRDELVEIREMWHVIPAEKQATRREIEERLKACLDRLAIIEERLGAGGESSSSLLPRRLAVHV